MLVCTRHNCEKLEVAILVKSIPGGWSFYTLVSGVTQHQYARPHPREGFNYYITCYLGNITVEERYEQHSCMLPT